MRKFLVLLAVIVALPAAPAAAHPEHGTFVEWRGPAEGAKVSGPKTRIQAKVAFGSDGVKSWRVEVLAPAGAGHPGFGTICEQAVGGAPSYVDIDCLWDTTLYAGDQGLSENHQYVIRLSAENAERGVFSNPSEIHTTERTVVVSNGVVAPSNVTLNFSEAGRQATVRWNRNPEPDVARYIIQERVGNDPWRNVGEAGSQLTSYTRRLSTPGTYRYQVAALRPSGAQGETLQSGFSGPSGEPREIVVAEPRRPAATTTTNTSPPAESAPGGGDPSPGPSDPGAGPFPVTAAGTADPNAPGDPPADGSTPPPGSALITQIEHGVPGSVGTTQTFGGTVLPGAPTPAAPKEAPEVDNGFSETLPYPKADAPAAGNGNGQGIARALVAQPSTVVSDDQRALVIPLATGLLLFVVAMHFFYLSRPRPKVEDTESPWSR